MRLLGPRGAAAETGQQRAVDVAVLAIAAALFVAAFIHAVLVVSIGWTHGIFDAHPFRQTQTAVSVYWMLQGGPLLAYHTPVLGYPWAIPLEFPLYQWLVAGLVAASGASIEASGRAVGVAFFLASLIPGWIVLGGLGLTPASRLLCLAMLLASPLYLFWSRTLMIESTALFLSLSYLAAVICWRRRRRAAPLVAAAAFGALAAMVKVTTFLGFLAAAGLLVGVDAWRARPGLELRRVRPYGLAAVAFALLPCLACVCWFAFCDALKEQNAFAAVLTSGALWHWTFGDWSQRLRAGTWLAIWQRYPNWFVSWAVLAMAAVALPFARGRRAMALSALALGVGVMLVFTNLHAVHDYYQYANAVFLLAAIGLALSGLVDAPDWRRVVGLGAFAAAIVFMLRAEGSWYLAFQASDPRPHDEFAEHVRAVTAPNDVLVIWGARWSPEIPWTAKRRALMDNPGYDPHGPEMTRALDALRSASYEITALVFCKGARVDGFLQPRLALFPGFRRVASGSNGCDLYAKSG